MKWNGAPNGSRSEVSQTGRFSCENDIFFSKMAKTVVFIPILLVSCSSAFADSAAEIDRKVDNALQSLYAATPSAKQLASVAKAVLVFPDIVKGGLVVGGQYGEGALLVDGKTRGYFNTVAASYGLHAGVQSFGYAMFFMTDEALENLKNADSWEVGVGLSVVLVDEGIANNLTTTTAKDDVCAFVFG